MAIKKVYLTREGARVSAFCQNNSKKVNFLSIGLGSGENYNPKEATGMTSERLTVPVQSVRRIESNHYKIRAMFNNNILESDLEYREVCLYCEDPENSGEQVMYCYGNAKTDDYDYTETIPAFSTTGNLSSRIIEIDTYVQGDSATYILDDSSKSDIATVQELRDDLEQEIKDRQDAIIDIAHGGTGATTAKSAQYKLLHDMEEDTTNAIDDTYFVSSYFGDSATKGTVYKRKGITVWEWIKSKISSVLGLTATQYNGNSATTNKWLCSNASYTGDINDCEIGKWYSVQCTTETQNSPTTLGWLTVMTFASNDNQKFKYQLAHNSTTKCFYIRSCSSGVWSEWESFATKSELNNVEVGATNLENATGVLAVEKGGTGQTTLKNACETLLPALSSDSGSDLSDNDTFIAQTFGSYRRPYVYRIWNYIKSKIETILGLTETEYNGNSATATKSYSDMIYDCTTDEKTVSKDLTIPNLVVENGTCIKVRFTNGNNVANPTLKINNLDPVIIEPENYNQMELQYGGYNENGYRRCAYRWHSDIILELRYESITKSWEIIGDPVVFESEINSTEVKVYLSGKKIMRASHNVRLHDQSSGGYKWTNGTIGFNLPIELTNTSKYCSVSVNIHHGGWNWVTSVTSTKILPYVYNNGSTDNTGATTTQSNVMTHWRVEGY